MYKKIVTLPQRTYFKKKQKCSLYEQSCSQTAGKTSDTIFDELISSIKRKRTLAKQLIEAQEKTAVAQAEELQLQLEEEITKLRRRDTELEQLSHVDDHIHFIQVPDTFQFGVEQPKHSLYVNSRSLKHAKLSNKSTAEGISQKSHRLAKFDRAVRGAPDDHI